MQFRGRYEASAIPCKPNPRQCTGGLNTLCTPPQSLEGLEKTLPISWK
jgi:hypothetical protein